MTNAIIHSEICLSEKMVRLYQKKVPVIFYVGKIATIAGPSDAGKTSIIIWINFHFFGKYNNGREYCIDII
ncbi:MAG: hypothetical protein C0P75_004575 [Bacilli bacterium]|uniref:ABC transporter domain-containing protein n=1 Tax=Ureibacillus suwonensis TaxID=313007 RepID=A0ABW0RB64_9BACL|nr:hypothetical protein [Bacilli bacterium]